MKKSPMRASSKPELSEGEIRLHDIVALLVDLPEQGLKRGAVGTVVEVFEKTAHHPAGYIVEFVDEATGAANAQADITNQASHSLAFQTRGSMKRAISHQLSAVSQRTEGRQLLEQASDKGSETDS